MTLFDSDWTQKQTPLRPVDWHTYAKHSSRSLTILLLWPTSSSNPTGSFENDKICEVGRCPSGGQSPNSCISPLWTEGCGNFQLIWSPKEVHPLAEENCRRTRDLVAFLDVTFAHANLSGTSVYLIIKANIHHLNVLVSSPVLSWLLIWKEDGLDSVSDGLCLGNYCVVPFVFLFWGLQPDKGRLWQALWPSQVMASKLVPRPSSHT